ncbi:hypothetical protein [Streptomyces gibsoniae]|uniref:Uncharacterized protein n=1 Tax=Streptomyces gibsoniae TaxID=3075529 RepID=A0ABU2U9V9_9ACTN|nr:hypothetical protein [Streptomyces sp. DSM 41699]MDT0470015.1 hypothetical protein [Streptomyces sp. DSM 41699]
MIDLADVDDRFTRLAAEYSLRRTAAHGLVVRWEWYEDEAFDLRPLYYERNLSRPGRRLAERPDPTRDHFQLGFDANDRLVVKLEYSGFLGGRLYYETFRAYPSGLVEEAHFHADGRPIYLHEYCFEGDRIRSAAMVATRGASYETYDYTDDRVTHVETHYGQRQSEGLLPLRPFAVIDAAHDGNGLTCLKTSDPQGHAEVTYERPPTGFTIADAWQTVQRKLLHRIPQAVRSLKIDTPAYCVALMYEDPADPACFTVHVGLDEDRRAALADGSDLDVRWSPADMAHETSVDLGTVTDTARLLAQELRLARSEAGRDLLRSMADTLSAADWTTALPVTEDFVVYAVDVEMEHLDWATGPRPPNAGPHPRA